MGVHDYFDSLVARPEAILDRAFRTQVEIDTEQPGGGDVVYDAAKDAAKFTILDEKGSVNTQLKPNAFTAVSTGTLLYTWESQWPSDFVSDGDIDGLRTHKAFQLTIDRGDDRALEPRTSFKNVDSPHVALTTMRIYPDTVGVGYTAGPADAIGPKTGNFNIAPDVWTRFWVLCDFDNDELTYWVGDETRTNIIILDTVPIDWDVAFLGYNGFKGFEFEYNSSQSRPGVFTELNIWGRNLVILQDLSNPVQTVADGDFLAQPPAHEGEFTQYSCLGLPTARRIFASKQVSVPILLHVTTAYMRGRQ